MKVWITKYALTSGILEREAEVCTDSTISVKGTGYCTVCFHGNEWHKSRESAIAKAEEMRKKKIASLKKQIEKLEKMEFKNNEIPT